MLQKNIPDLSRHYQFLHKRPTSLHSWTMPPKEDDLETNYKRDNRRRRYIVPTLKAYDEKAAISCQMHNFNNSSMIRMKDFYSSSSTSLQQDQLRESGVMVNIRPNTAAMVAQSRDWSFRSSWVRSGQDPTSLQPSTINRTLRSHNPHRLGWAGLIILQNPLIFSFPTRWGIFVTSRAYSITITTSMTLSARSLFHH